MSQFVIPNRNLSHQRQGQVVDGGEGIRSSHVQNHPSLGCVVPMSTNNGVTELTWKNGHPSMHDLSNIITSPSPMNPTTCSRPAEHTLESIVHQATCQHKHSNLLKNMIVQTQKRDHPSMMNRSLNTSTTTSGGKPTSQNAGQVQMLQQQDMVKKRVRSETESDQCGRYLNSSSRMHDLGTEINACARASATFCRENSKDTTLMTWASFESPATMKTKTNDDDSASHGGLENRDEEQEVIGGGCVQTCSARRSRSAAIHNQSERRRRDRINQKLQALQKLVPNASKNDKASMLDEVIEYLKQLQAQVHMMRTRAMPAEAQLMMMNINNPAALAVQQQQQQQLQMSLLAAAARLGMSAGMGLGFLDVNAMARTAAATPHSLQPLLHSNPTVAPTPPAFLPPPFVVPPALPPTVTAAAPNSSSPLSHPYSAFLAQQTADMDFYRKMAVLYRQQANPMLPSFNQG